MNFHRLLLATCFACSFPFSVFAEAPVVDDSENFALLDEQQVAAERPVANTYDDNSSEEPALAQDNSSASTDKDVGLLDKMKGLQQDVQELRGQLEVQSHDLKVLQQQQLDFYKDLDARIRHEPIKAAQNTPPTEMNVAPTPISTPTASQTIAVAPEHNQVPITQPVVAPVHGNPADEQISYLSAYELVKNKRYDEASTAMQAFVTQYPQGGYTANAQYWLGELCMVKKNYPQAIEHFNVVLQQYPSSSKSSASMLKRGYALAASGKTSEARTQLQQVVKTYPDTNTAQLANAKLQSLGAG